jgi:MFS family permease
VNAVEKRNLNFLLWGRFISFIGNNMQMVAIPLYILDVTGSGVLMGTYLWMVMSVSAATSVFAGVCGDRWNRKNIMVNTDFIRAFLVLILAILAKINSMSLVLLFAVHVILSIQDTFFNASSNAILPELVETQGLSSEDARKKLTDANGQKGIFDSISPMLGLALGGIVYGSWGIQAVFLVDAISFIISGLYEGQIKYQSKAVDKPRLTLSTLYHENMEVCTFILNNKGLLQILTYAIALAILITPLYFVVLPYAFKEVIGFTSAQYGYLQALYFVGMLLGSVAAIYLYSKISAKRLIQSGIVSQIVVQIIIGLVLFPPVIAYMSTKIWTYFGIIGVLVALWGILCVIYNIPIMTNFQKMLTPDITARFFALFDMLGKVIFPIGFVISGLVLDKSVPVYQIMILCSFAALGATAVFITVASNEVYEPK